MFECLSIPTQVIKCLNSLFAADLRIDDRICTVVIQRNSMTWGDWREWVKAWPVSLLFNRCLCRGFLAHECRQFLSRQLLLFAWLSEELASVFQNQVAAHHHACQSQQGQKNWQQSNHCATIVCSWHLMWSLLPGNLWGELTHCDSVALVNDEADSCKMVWTHLVLPSGRKLAKNT